MEIDRSQASRTSWERNQLSLNFWFVNHPDFFRTLRHSLIKGEFEIQNFSEMISKQIWPHEQYMAIWMHKLNEANW